MGIKKSIKKLIEENEKVADAILKIPFCYQPVYRIALNSKVIHKLKKIYKNMTVLRGPFKGLKYPTFHAAGSSLFPKLIGVYEKEIQEIIYEMKDKNLEFFIDVGCAEGYYAVGVAKYKLAEKVVGYDIDEYARSLCSNLAVFNDAELTIKSEMSMEELNNFSFTKDRNSFLMVDCEGYEKDLFNKNNVLNLKNVYCLIEVHDWCQNEFRIKDYLESLFNDSHTIKVFYGIDDYDKAYDYNLKELEHLEIKERFVALAERRRRLGCWMYMIPKS